MTSKGQAARHTVVAMAWRVFPVPISSAISARPCRSSANFTPSTWKGRRECLRDGGSCLSIPCR
eukprot:8359323-Pyramimonas_sp.AAC.1